MEVLNKIEDDVNMSEVCAERLKNIINHRTKMFRVFLKKRNNALAFRLIFTQVHSEL